MRRRVKVGEWTVPPNHKKTTGEFVPGLESFAEMIAGKSEQNYKFAEMILGKSRIFPFC